MNQHEQLIEDLRAARERVEAGWCQNDFEDQHGNVCMVGAIHKTVCGYASLADRPLSEEQGNRITRVFRAVKPHSPYPHLSFFNDLTDTTKQCVLDVFDKALANEGGMA